MVNMWIKSDPYVKPGSESRRGVLIQIRVKYNYVKNINRTCYLYRLMSQAFGVFTIS